MQYLKVIYHNDPSTPYYQLVELLHEAFKERDEAGMNFGCSTFTIDDLKKDTEGGYIVVYFDEGIPIAMGCLIVKKMNLGGFYGVFKHMAVSPSNKYRGKGLGVAVQRERVCVARDLKLSFVTSSTAIEAVSSVKCHLKSGFKIYRVKHYKGKNYNSYCFFIPLNKHPLNLFISVFRRPIFLFSKLLLVIK